MEGNPYSDLLEEVGSGPGPQDSPTHSGSPLLSVLLPPAAPPCQPLPHTQLPWALSVTTQHPFHTAPFLQSLHFLSVCYMQGPAKAGAWKQPQARKPGKVTPSHAALCPAKIPSTYLRFSPQPPRPVACFARSLSFYSGSNEPSPLSCVQDILSSETSAAVSLCLTSLQKCVGCCFPWCAEEDTEAQRGCPAA